MVHSLTRLLGDTPLRVIIKLVLLSFVVGGLMTMLGWTPMDVVYKVLHFIEGLWSMGFAAFHVLSRVLLLGAAIVVPIFVIFRLLSLRS